jgi:hypothetical protein
VHENLGLIQLALDTKHWCDVKKNLMKNTGGRKEVNFFTADCLEVLLTVHHGTFMNKHLLVVPSFVY